MIHAHDIPPSVQWFEGMLLAPQHFQRQAQHHERLLSYHLGLAAPFHWGIHHARFDPSLLMDGMVRVLSLEAILPDGLVVSHSHTEPALRLPTALELDLRPHAEAARREPLRIHLAVPLASRTTPQAGGELSRFVSVTGEPVLDGNTGDSEMALAELRPRACLIAGTPPSRYSHLPLLAVRCEGESFTVDDYIAPRLDVAEDSALGYLCDEVARRVREKALYLSDLLRSPSMSADPSLLEESAGILHHLVAGLPTFEAVLRARCFHPFTVYTALCGLAGHLAAVGESLVPPVFSGYEHLELRRCFQEVADFISRCLDEGVSEAFQRVPLRLARESFTTRFHPDWMDRELILGVRGQPGSTEQQVRDWVKGCRIGAESRLRAMREMRVLGAQRRPIERREGLVPRRGMFLFSLEATPSFVVQNDPLVVENAAEGPDLPRPAEVCLYVRMKR
jgi:type VI secretion system protein ImpJ